MAVIDDLYSCLKQQCDDHQYGRPHSVAQMFTKSTFDALEFKTSKGNSVHAQYVDYKAWRATTNEADMKRALDAYYRQDKSLFNRIARNNAAVLKLRDEMGEVEFARLLVEKGAYKAYAHLNHMAKFPPVKTVETAPVIMPPKKIENVENLPTSPIQPIAIAPALPVLKPIDPVAAPKTKTPAKPMATQIGSTNDLVIGDLNGLAVGFKNRGTYDTFYAGAAIGAIPQYAGHAEQIAYMKTGAFLLNPKGTHVTYQAQAGILNNGGSNAFAPTSGQYIAPVNSGKASLMHPITNNRNLRVGITADYSVAALNKTLHPQYNAAAGLYSEYATFFAPNTPVALMQFGAKAGMLSGADAINAVPIDMTPRKALMLEAHAQLPISKTISWFGDWSYMRSGTYLDGHNTRNPAVEDVKTPPKAEAASAVTGLQYAKGSATAQVFVAGSPPVAGAGWSMNTLGASFTYVLPWKL